VNGPTDWEAILVITAIVCVFIIGVIDMLRLGGVI
jgi:hypothetical protein